MTTAYPSNAIVHFDIAGPDDEALRDFYSGLFGWELRSPGPGYALVSTPDGQRLGDEGADHRPGGKPDHADQGLNDDSLDERLRALSHPVRRTLISACLHEPQPAGELAKLTNLAPASVSEHLKVLRKTGLLILDRDGRFRRYRADPDAVREVVRALASYASW